MQIQAFLSLLSFPSRLFGELVSRLFGLTGSRIIVTYEVCPFSFTIALSFLISMAPLSSQYLYTISQ